MLRIVVSIVSAFAAIIALSAPAAAGDQRWLTLSAGEREMVDRLAADLYVADAPPSEAGDPWAAAARTWSRDQGLSGGQPDAYAAFLRLSPATQAPYRRRAMDILGAQPAKTAPAGARDI